MAIDLRYELDGVIADAKAGKFDKTCIATLEHISIALSHTTLSDEECVFLTQLINKAWTWGTADADKQRFVLLLSKLNPSWKEPE